MNSSILKRLEQVERSLTPASGKSIVVIWSWADDTGEVREEKFARWVAGENVEGAPTDVVDRANANVLMVVFRTD